MTDLESDDQALACDWLNVRADEDFRTNHAVSLSPLFVFFFFFSHCSLSCHLFSFMNTPPHTLSPSNFCCRLCVCLSTPP